MRKTRSRTTLVIIIAVLVIIGMVVFIVRTAMNSQQWIQHTYNGHLSGNGGLSTAGAIYDRNGIPLAYSENDLRLYNQDHMTRLSTLHVVGDDSLNISTAIQSSYRAKLIGFNYIWGLGMPKSLKGGNDIHLNIDANACNAAYNALNGYNGAVVVYNYKTGEVLCSVSTPTYDPLDPPEITEENEAEYDGIYIDKVLAGRYTPGSIFKVVTLASALENINGVEDEIFRCDGSVIIGGEKISCMHNHGDITLKDGLAQSCNIVFAELAQRLGIEKMTATAEKMGFNSTYKINGTITAQSTYNVDKANENDLAWSGIGQYTLESNPMHMAIICGAIANGGSTPLPEEIKSGVVELKLDDSGDVNMLDSQLANKLDEYMRYNVTSYYGDGLFPSLTICAKTGTAEVGDDKEPHAWMMGYSQDKDIPLAFAAVVENGGYGYSTAGPVAVAAMETCANTLRAELYG
ncbi:MAG: penicillin-binding transpeptidase domain-containing protein [Acutalibacteraceae bacterium]|nr:penicillin-binding transpeptidase domain-containing protein [Acutalibacteraceae bacterium]